MRELQIDTLVPPLSDETIEVAERAERLGFDGVWSMENSNDGFLPHVLAAEHTDRVTMGNRIALSFTRSPMVVAQMAWDLARYSNGRYVLGLGTQVKGHNERRFSVEWKSPGPRLREVIESIRHIWEVFQGEADALNYDGEHYSFSLLTDRFDPGPIDHPDIPIYIGGVNEYNLRLAGELCDGLSIHPFTSNRYANDVIAERIAEGAARADRDPDEIEILASPLVITGDSEEEMAENRERVRRRVAFYGSTRTYHDVLDIHGWTSLGQDLHELSKEKKWDEMADLVTDEMLATFTVEALPEDLVDAAATMYEGVADRVVLPMEYAEAYMTKV
ncbi:LLM class F420-dependent oxidoreductase [Haladaptatus sp. W1]|uniref:TIGR03617 family F420-dependent LLM class oxidoreductase n=1 Tax=Haladaptatus sp. W1 TaxID=1897478 RepID=UPI000849B55E|nr:TIGR03617 family F420-dependent LLM class oxidoreductase [Haladaptatus sp. W1]ODR83494.1 LLM class F420-dependent oxidoreductase [Haladaptatus sp. W1]